MIQYKLHKLKEGFIVTSDEITRKEANLIPHYQSFDSKFYKVLAQQEQIDLSNLSEDDHKKIGWFKLEESYYNELYERREKAKNFKGQIAGRHPDALSSHEIHAMVSGYLEGFQKAMIFFSDKTYDIEQLRFIYDTAIHAQMERLNHDEEFEKVISFLSKPKSWEIEGFWEFNFFKITKIVNM
jgi:hypothetical protein